MQRRWDVARSGLAAGLLVVALLGGRAIAAELPMDTVLIDESEAGVQVTRADVAAALQQMPESRRQGVLASEKALGQLLDSLFVTRMLAGEARDQGLADDPVARARVRQAEERVLSRLRVEAMSAAMDEDAAETLAEERYRVNRDDYVAPEKVRVRHILIRTDERSEADARDLAAELAAQLREAPDRFTALAAEHSDDRATAQDGGELPPFPRGEMAKPFEEAAFSLEDGEISDPVKTRFGYHVIRKIEHLPERQQSFSEVRDELVQGILQDRTRAQYQQRAAELREQPSAAVNWEAINRIVEAHGGTVTPPDEAGAPAGGDGGR